ncbi:hypothetical protein Pcinc_033087 [Petrolisthes cinctipes]|uniref:Uncharacterized protein n=1 Tax=Petrolisthes cinctipes TaxID=88211 RepID=A0AAE1JZH4_PETCI|nr:hypothetical protein Pcinc_033087 [Petrolisthes cinctipes]
MRTNHYCTYLSKEYRNVTCTSLDGQYLPVRQVGVLSHSSGPSPSAPLLTSSSSGRRRSEHMVRGSVV